MPTNPVILITGASSGIGEAAARIFARQGYSVALVARRQDRLELLVRELEAAGGQALAVPADVAKLGDIQHAVRSTLDCFGQIDVLFNNAGFGRMGWLENLDPAGDVQAQIAVNLTGVILMAREVLPAMIARRSGHIINMVSIAGLVATPTYSIYAATKFGVRGFTEALRREVGVYGLKVSGIYPGGVDNEFSQQTGAKRKTGIKTPAFLQLTSEQVAEAVFDLVRRPQTMKVLPWSMKLPIWANSLFPQVADRLIAWRFVKPERM